MRNVFAILLVVCVLAAFFLGYASNVTIAANPAAGLLNTPIPGPVFIQDSSPSNAPLFPQPTPFVESTVINMTLPAVDKDDVGQLAELVIEARPGKGRVYIGFDESPLINADTQSSLRVALDVAKRYAGIDNREMDVSYTFTTQSDVVGGKSAGAAATIGTMAALEKSKLKTDTLITGTVEPDGHIGPVGKILEKARAAKKAGFKTILVPVGESFQSVSVDECHESNQNGAYVKECYSTIKKVDIAQDVGMKVIEVSTIPDAYKLFKAA